MASYSPLIDEEAGFGSKPFADPSFNFAEKQVRLGFVRKVFGLLSIQLAITAGVAATFIYSPPVKSYVFNHQWTFWTAFGVSLGLILFMGLYENARRSHPWNILLLFAFTGCEAVLVGTVSAMYDTEVVLLAAGITAGVVFALTLFTFQTKVDVTASGGILFSLLMALLIGGILQIFIHAKWLHLAICLGGAILFSVYLVFDIQLLMGEGRYALSPDEYIFAALNLYLDIVNLFLYILQLINDMNRS